MEQLLFFHGGPGLNSNPERLLLTEMYQASGIELCTWDEPSALRGTLSDNNPSTRFEQLLQSAADFLLQHYKGQPLSLMSSSMGCQIITRLLENYPDKIKKIFFSGPCFHTRKSDLRLFRLIIADYRNKGDDASAEQLQKVVQNASSIFGANEITGWNLVLSHPLFFDHYWHNPDLGNRYLECFTAPDYSMDPDGFFAGRASMVPPAPQKYPSKAVVFYGTSDKITDLPSEIATIEELFPHHSIIKMERSGHFPHVEEAATVLEIIRQEIERRGNNG